MQRMDDAPEKFLGMDVGRALELDSNNRGIVYLSESQSELFVRERDAYKEVVYSSRVAGNNNGFSFNEASDLLFSFYPNLSSEEHTSQLQSQMRISYPVFCLQK